MRLPTNEPVLSYAPGSPERAELRSELERQAAAPVRVRLHIGADPVESGDWAPIRAPHRHDLLLGEYAVGHAEHARRAIDAALAAREGWAARDLESRAAVFRRAADLLAGPFRMRLNAATMLGQSKTPHQAEIDAACELADFFRFNAYYAERLAEEPLISPEGEQNWFDLRPLDGFVYAVTPFNFTSIAGNLPTAPALLGNTVVWKPSPYAMLAAHHVFDLLREAGLPDGVINLVSGDAEEITREVLAHPDFSGLHFTGSTAVFREIFRRVAEAAPRYRSYPRLVAETGGKDFVVAHRSADVLALAVALVRGAFEYQGQKCSAASRVYVPRSIAPELEARLRELLAEVQVGDPTDFSTFMGALIHRAAYERVTGYIER
ncbi:MAG: aldehyde dehydrogenase family protein, partial [Pseudomonadota bacterium]